MLISVIVAALTTMLLCSTAAAALVAQCYGRKKKRNGRKKKRNKADRNSAEALTSESRDMTESRCPKQQQTFSNCRNEDGDPEEQLVKTARPKSNRTSTATAKAGARPKSNKTSTSTAKAGAGRKSNKTSTSTAKAGAGPESSARRKTAASQRKAAEKGEKEKNKKADESPAAAAATTTTRTRTRTKVEEKPLITLEEEEEGAMTKTDGVVVDESGGETLFKTQCGTGVLAEGARDPHQEEGHKADQAVVPLEQQFQQQFRNIERQRVLAAKKQSAGK